MTMAFRKKKDLGHAFRNDRQIQQFILTDVTKDSTCAVLGTGSYGSVEEVKYRKVTCASKSIHETLIDIENEGVSKIVNKYLQECLLMSSLRHPNVTQFLGLCFFPETQLPVIVMERLETSLDDLLEHIPSLPLSLKRSLLEDVASGLLYLHKLEPPVIHRDLTARNILLTAAPIAKIADMGNSRIIDMKSSKKAQALTKVPGTLVYMPPEALDDKHCYGPSLDIFSFGHLALYTVTQKFPGDLLPSTFPNPDDAKGVTGRTEVERREVYINLLGTHIGQIIQNLIKQCLHNDPKVRPDTSEVLSVLQGMKAEVEGDYGGPVRLDMARVRLAKKNKLQDLTIHELVQQQERLETEVKALKEEIEELQKVGPVNEVEKNQQQDEGKKEPDTKLNVIVRDQIKIIKKLEDRQFVETWEGLWNNAIKVTVKMCKTDHTTAAKFLQEAKILTLLSHKNVIQLYGVCLQDPAYIVTELMHTGNLSKYLTSDLKTPAMIDMCCQVACGMAYLESQKCVHCDLAMRNIQVNENKICKISGFTMAFILNSEERERVYIDNQVLPIRWTAPEVLMAHGKFSVKSDVWSFGILLHEITTYGGLPYPEKKNYEVVEAVKDNYRMPCPDKCPQKLYNLMLDCWSEDPNNRPTFDTLQWLLKYI